MVGLRAQGEVCVFGGPTNYVVGIIFSLRPGKQFRFPLADICRHVCLWPAKNRCFLIYWLGLQTFIPHPTVIAISPLRVLLVPPAKLLLKPGGDGQKTLSAAGRQIKVPTLLVMCFLISNISRVTRPPIGKYTPSRSSPPQSNANAPDRGLCHCCALCCKLCETRRPSRIIRIWTDRKRAALWRSGGVPEVHFSKGRGIGKRKGSRTLPQANWIGQLYV